MNQPLKADVPLDCQRSFITTIPVNSTFVQYVYIFGNRECFVGLTYCTFEFLVSFLCFVSYAHILANLICVIYTRSVGNKSVK